MLGITGASSPPRRGRLKEILKIGEPQWTSHGKFVSCWLQSRTLEPLTREHQVKRSWARGWGPCEAGRWGVPAWPINWAPATKGCKLTSAVRQDCRPVFNFHPVSQWLSKCSHTTCHSARHSPLIHCIPPPPLMKRQSMSWISPRGRLCWEFSSREFWLDADIYTGKIATIPLSLWNSRELHRNKAWDPS